MFALFVTALFVVFNGLFVAAEFSLVKLRATQLEQLGKRSDRRSRAVVAICQRLDRYLSATQLGITLASLGLGWVGEPAIASLFVRAGLAVGIPPSHALHSIAFAIGFAGLTSVHIIFGELVPKLVAISSAEGTALRVARPLQTFYIAALPALAVLNGASSLLLRALGRPALTNAEGALSEEEILGMLTQAYAHGRLSQAKRQLLERVMRFNERTVRQVMVPRLDVTSLDVDLSIPEAVARARVAGYTRYPLVEGGDLDNTVGYVNIKDVVLFERPPESLRQSLRDVIVVPESIGLFDLMREFQRRQTHLALVVDEYGGTSGIVTLEDVLEEIVGEIRDEHDEEPAKVQQRGDGALVADGMVTLHDLRAHGVDLSEVDADTIGGAVLERLGRLARPGDEVSFARHDVRVDVVRRRRVARVVIRRRPEALTSGAPED